MILKILLISITICVYFLIHRSVISLTVLRTFILYPNINSPKEIKKIHVIAARSILTSFIFSPTLSFILFRSFYLNKLENNTYKSRTLFFKSKLIIIELIADLITLIATYISIYFLVLNYSLLTLFLLLSIGLIFIIINKNDIIILKKNDEYILKKFFKNNRLLAFVLVSFNRIIRIIVRDFSLILLIYFIINNNLNISSLSNSFKQALTFSLSNYMQILPANLIVPEAICSYLNCLIINYSWIRLALFFASLTNLINFEKSKVVNFPI